MVGCVNGNVPNLKHKKTPLPNVWPINPCTNITQYEAHALGWRSLSNLCSRPWCIFCVATLTLGLRPRQGFTKVWTKTKRESHFMLPGVQKSVREWALTLPSELPFCKLDFHFLRRRLQGPNSLDWKVSYIIGKLLQHRCLKWACMTHLYTWNTSYGQKKGQESNWQFDSRPLKVGNRPDFLVCRWHVTYRWKALDEGYNFA
jgi:hypothetical protein